MAALIGMSRAVWKRQPQGNVDIDYNNSLNKNLAYYFIHGKLKNNSPLIATASLESSTDGISGRFKNSKFEFSSENSYTFVNALTIGVRLKIDSLSNYSGIIHQQVDTATRGWEFRLGSNNPDGNILLHRASNDAYRQMSGSTQLVYPRDKFYSIVVTTPNLDISSFPTAFVDGVENVLGGYPIQPTLMTTPAAKVMVGRRIDDGVSFDGLISVIAVWDRSLSAAEAIDWSQNPWQLFKPRIARFISIPSSSSSIGTASALLDALIQKSFIRSLSVDALLQKTFASTISVDALIAATQSGVISLDALAQTTKSTTIDLDALIQAVHSGSLSVDALLQITLSPSLTLDALLQAVRTATVDIDALVQKPFVATVVIDALVQAQAYRWISLDALIQKTLTSALSVDALLQMGFSSSIELDAFIQKVKSGSVSLDALIVGSGLTAVSTLLDALIQAIKTKSLSLDALIQHGATSQLVLDALIAGVRTATVSLDSLIQAVKVKTLSLDALLQMTKGASVSFDSLIQAAKVGTVSLDAILILATACSVSLDALVQARRASGVSLDAIIGAIAAIIMPTGRVIQLSPSERLIQLSPSERLITF